MAIYSFAFLACSISTIIPFSSIKNSAGIKLDIGNGGNLVELRPIPELRRNLKKSSRGLGNIDLVFPSRNDVAATPSGSASARKGYRLSSHNCGMGAL